MDEIDTKDEEQDTTTFESNIRTLQHEGTIYLEGNEPRELLAHIQFKHVINETVFSVLNYIGDHDNTLFEWKNHHKQILVYTMGNIEEWHPDTKVEFIQNYQVPQSLTG